MTSGLKTLNLTAFAAAFALACLGGCKTTDPGSGIQIWQKAWDGASDERTDPILIKAQGIECGVDGRGDIVFTPRDQTNFLEFPDGSLIAAEEMRVVLRKVDQETEIGIGPYEMQLNLNGAITLTGPFSKSLQAWFGEDSENGELTALFSGASKGPMIMRCPVHLMAIWVTGRAMKFGTIAREPQKPAEDDDQPADDQPADDQPADDQPADDQPADDMNPDDQPSDDSSED